MTTLICKVDPAASRRIEKKPRQAELLERARRLAETTVEFIPNDSFRDAAHREEFLQVEPHLHQERTGNGRNRSEAGPVDLLCDTPLLSADAERALFRSMNLHKYLAEMKIAQINLADIDAALLDEIEGHLAKAEEIRNALVQANGRLVVSIVKKFADGRNGFDELLSDGLITLLRCVEKFDYDRGFRFSTYATHAVRRDAYRQIRNRQKDQSHVSTFDPEFCEQPATSSVSEEKWEKVTTLLDDMIARLDRREQMIVRARFGMDRHRKPQTLQKLATKLGVCKERVRQLEKRALGKLQDMAGEVHLPEVLAMIPGDESLN